MARNAHHIAISACLIVRNEQRTLERCLATLNGVVDELVVVDTGSSDATRGIAQRHGARLFQTPWNDDFAAARNTSIAHAAGDWVLWVDADEELIEAQPGALRRLCHNASDDVWGYWLGVRCPYGERGEQEMRLSQWRLFRNHHGITFHGRVHEQPEPPRLLQSRQVPDQAAVSVLHHGYATSAEAMSAKLERNRRLMERCIAEQPDDPFQRFNLGRQLVRESRWAEGLAELERAIISWQRAGAPAARYVHLLFAFAAQAAVGLGRYERALEIEAQAGDTFASADLLCETGLACWKLGRQADAIVRLTQCFSNPALVTSGGHDLATSTWRPRALLAQVHDELGQPGRALELALSALLCAPRDPQVQLLAAHLSNRANRPVEDTLPLLRPLTQHTDATLQRQARRVLLELGDRLNDAALLLEALEGEVDGLPPADALLIQAAAYDHQGRQELRKTALARGRERFPDDARFAEPPADPAAEAKLLPSAPAAPIQITACLIVKNEEQHLPACLAALRAAVDEIVIVDTGSADATVAIAEAAGARVFDYPWCDDFSAARNVSLEHASGDFILWIDADDVLIEGEPGALRQLCTSLPATSWGYWMDVHCPTTPYDDSETLVKQNRLLRNHLGIRFQGRIHEQAFPPAEHEGSGLTHQSRVSIRHVGYIPDGDLLAKKRTRNLKLLQLASAEEPLNPFNYYNLGLQRAAAHEFEAALEPFQRALAIIAKQPPEHDGYVANLYATAALAATEAGRHEQALELRRQAPAAYQSSMLVYQAGLACWRLGRPAEAMAHLQQAMEDRRLEHPNVSTAGASTWRPAVALAVICAEADDYAAAEGYALAALRDAPEVPELLFMQAHIAHHLGRDEESIARLRQLLAGSRESDYKRRGRRLLLDIATNRGDDALAVEALAGEVQGLSLADATSQAAQAHLSLGQPAAALAVLRQACAAHPEDVAVRLWLGRLLEDQGEPEQGLVVLAEGMDQPGAPPVLYQRLAVLLAKAGRLEDAANALQIASQLEASAAPDATAAARPAPARRARKAARGRQSADALAAAATS